MLSNYADDNNLFSIRKDINKVKDTFAENFRIVPNWFYENFMVLNSKKCHFMCIGRGRENETFTFKNVCYKNSKEELILGIIIDNKLNFNSHIRKMCKKSGQKKKIFLTAISLSHSQLWTILKGTASLTRC